MDDELAQQAHQLGINISAAARDGVAEAVRAALLASDRDAYRQRPEHVDDVWSDAEAWGDS
jgi:post-segregation antitoxin (ccd killing protein)